MDLYLSRLRYKTSSSVDLSANKSTSVNSAYVIITKRRRYSYENKISSGKKT